MQLEKGFYYRYIKVLLTGLIELDIDAYLAEGITWFVRVWLGSHSERGQISIALARNLIHHKSGRTVKFAPGEKWCFSLYFHHDKSQRHKARNLFWV